MHIERLLRDKSGTKVRLGAIEYHFKEAWPDGAHVAPVEDEAHRAVLLSIPEGYREYAGSLPSPQTSAVAAVIAPVSISHAVPAAPPAPIKAAGSEMAEQEPQTDQAEDALEAMSDESLRAIFKAELGRVAPPKSKMETMIAQIRAWRDEAASEKKD